MVKHSIIGLIATLGFISSVNAAVIHDESIDGDLSDDNLMPTEIPLIGSVSLGSNLVRGTTIAAPIDRDFWSLTIPDGQALTAIVIEAYSNTDNVGLSQSFFAVREGIGFPAIDNPDVLLGSALIGAAPGSQQGDNILDDLGQALPGGSGFNGSLGSGTYTFWTQETVGEVTYSFDFQISTVPEPTSILSLLAIGSFGAIKLASSKKS
jgi:hypothetical protein